VISDSPRVTVRALAEATGWEVKPQGACKDVRCVPLPADARAGDLVDLRAFADALRMPLLHDEDEGLWSLGPEAGGAALTSVQVPDLVLPTLSGEPFELARLRGRKVLIAAWASW
jgi:hypothetical protein